MTGTHVRADGEPFRVFVLELIEAGATSRDEIEARVCQRFGLRPARAERRVHDALRALAAQRRVELHPVHGWRARR